MLSQKAEQMLREVRALRKLSQESGVNTISAQSRLLRRLSPQDLTDVAKALAEGGQQ